MRQDQLAEMLPPLQAYDVFPTNNPSSKPIFVRRALVGPSGNFSSTVVWDSGGETAPTMVVDGSHAVYRAWNDYCGLTPATLNSPCSLSGGQILFSKSTDEGASFLTTPITVRSTTMGLWRRPSQLRRAVHLGLPDAPGRPDAVARR